MARAGIEIERKFLVAALPDGVAGAPAEPIRQDHLAIAPDGVEVRVRLRGEGGGSSRRATTCSSTRGSSPSSTSTRASGNPRYANKALALRSEPL